MTKLQRVRLAAVASAQTAVAAQADPRLEITNLRLFAVREPVSGRGYSILKLETRGGLIGYGEGAGISASETARVLGAIRAREATAFQVVRNQLSASPGMRAALDLAMLDVVARFSNVPLYQFLGGPTRHKVRVLAPLEGASDAELEVSLRRAHDAGYRAFLVPVPGETSRNRRPAFVRTTRRRLESLREAAGEGSDFVLDGAASLTPGDAATLASDLEMFYLMWFDEPCPVSNLAAVKQIATETVTPLGFGRHVEDAGTFQDLLREDAIDALRPDVSRAGISEIRRLAAMAETYYVAVAPFHDGGPIASAAALHLAACLPNFFIQQIPFPHAQEDRKMRAALAGGAVETIVEGFAALPKGTGLGITVNENALRQYAEGAR